MKSKKFLAIGSSLLLIVALFTAGFGTAAAADPGGGPATPTGSLSGVATCDTTDGSATVTWTLTNNESQRMWVTWSANAYVPNSASLAANSSETFTTAVSAPAAGKTLSETVKLKWADDSTQTGVTASVTVGSGCLPPAVAVGTLTAAATCNADGSGTVTWTLTNEYNRTMSVTWTANASISSQNNTVAPRASKTFTKSIAAPAANVSASATIKLSWTDGSSQGKTSASATVPSDCAPAPVASGTLVADATCNADGSGTVTWTLTNEYNGVMSVTWSANAIISNQTTVAAHASKTFTKVIAAPAAGKSASETVKLSWRDGSSQGKTTAGATVGTDCITPPPPPVCAASDFSPQNMWEVTWGYDFEHRNGGAPIFTMQSNGGLTQLNGGPVPSYMTSSWHWLYVGMGSADRVWTYTFADGTVRTATVTGADCTPTIVWATIAPVADATATATADAATCLASSATFSLENATWADAADTTDGSRVANADPGHTFADGSTQLVVTYTMATQIDWKDAACQPFFTVEQSCGYVKITYHNASKWPRWPDTHYTGDGVTGKNAGSGLYYSAHKVEAGATLVIFEKTFAEDLGGGHIEVWYQDILGAERDIDATPGTLQVTTDCLPPAAIATTASASFLDHTCPALGSMTLTGEHVTWTLVNDNATAAGPGGTVITGVPSGTWPALLDGSSPQSATNTPYYGGTTVTAVADPGYVLAAPYSEQFTAHEPTGCLTTLALGDQGTTSGAAGAGDLTTLALTGANVNGLWLLFASGFLVFGGLAVGISRWLGRRAL